jgi:hypothetical protein
VGLIILLLYYNIVPLVDELIPVLRRKRPDVHVGAKTKKKSNAKTKTNIPGASPPKPRPRGAQQRAPLGFPRRPAVALDRCARRGLRNSGKIL